MKFKVGDKVRVKSLDWYRQEYDDKGKECRFTPVMSKLCGKVVTIRAIPTDNECYLIEEQRVFSRWQDYMFEEEVVTENEDVIEDIEVDKNVQSFKNIANELCDLYEKKNKAYGNSFGDTYKKLGIISAVTRISDKYNRLCNLATNPNIDNLGESIEDTLKDLAAYSIMTLNELRNRKEE